MRTFAIQTLGCKVNQYEAQQIAALCRSHGLVETDVACADVRIVHTCSVTSAAAAKSRSTVNRSVRLPLYGELSEQDHSPPVGVRTIVTGCWATSDPDHARRLPGVDAVITHRDDVRTELDRLLRDWSIQGCPSAPVNRPRPSNGTHALPILGHRQAGVQRALLKVQDGCDAHCTYCIIPKLRPALWSKPIETVIDEARRLVDAGHVELVLTGIFLGAYGQPTALRRRQPAGETPPLAHLVRALCTTVPGLRRVRLSSLEPGDLADDLIAELRSHPQVVPHFHLPLQSGSDHLLRRMNRQYTRDDFLRMVDRVNTAFDRPALTTDIIVGFPGETDAEFARTLEVVDHAKFIHVHAFTYSARSGTAAARWRDGRVNGAVANQRIATLRARADEHSYTFRQQFIGETTQILIERQTGAATAPLRHGRCPRYFDVWVDDPRVRTGDVVHVRIAHVTRDRTLGVYVKGDPAWPA